MKAPLLKRWGALILLLSMAIFSALALASKQFAPEGKTAIDKRISHKKTNNQKEYSRNSEASTLPDLRKYPSGTKRKQAFLQAVVPYIKKQNALIEKDRDFLLSKRYSETFSVKDRERLKGITQRYKISWKGNVKTIPWNTLLERVDIIPTSMAATMAAAESGWGTSKLARSNNNLFGMKCAKKHCNSEPGKVTGYQYFDSLKDGINAYVVNLNTHPAYASFRKSRAQLRKTDQEVTASNMIHKLNGYSTKGSKYNNYLFAMYQSNQSLMVN